MKRLKRYALCIRTRPKTGVAARVSPLSLSRSLTSPNNVRSSSPRGSCSDGNARHRSHDHSDSTLHWQRPHLRSVDPSRSNRSACLLHLSERQSVTSTTTSIRTIVCVVVESSAASKDTRTSCRSCAMLHARCEQRESSLTLQLRAHSQAVCRCEAGDTWRACEEHESRHDRVVHAVPCAAVAFVSQSSLP